MDRLRRVFTENLSLKVLSVLLGFLLWSFVRGSAREEMAVVVPVELERVPSRLCVREISPPSVTVRLRGVIHKLNHLKVEELRARLDLIGARPGINSFFLRPEDFNLPGGIEVLGVSPVEVRVRLSPVVTRRVPVKVVLRGSPAPGFSVAGVVVEPKEVLVIGPQEAVEGLTEVPTEEVVLDGISHDLEVEVPLAVGDLPLRGCEPQKVKVRIRMKKTLPEVGRWESSSGPTA